MYKNPQEVIDKIEEKEINKLFFKELIPEDAKILEAGAHIGRDTIKFAKIWPNGKIYSFEPVPELFERLKENTQNYSNVNTFNLALSNNIGKVQCYISSGRSTALSSLKEPIKDVGLNSQTDFSKSEVDSMPLDKWAQNENIKNLDLIWLDAQGCELEILKSGEKILEKSKILYIEGSLMQRYVGENLINDTINWLEDRNFKAILRDKPKHNKVNILFKNLKSI